MSTKPMRGVWKRLWEEDPLGDAENADRDTLVLWTQSPDSGLYVDIRLPKGSPGRSPADAKAAGCVPTPSALQARGLSMDVAKLSTETVDVLLRQKSFAGQLMYTLGDTTSGEALEKDAPLAQLAANAKRDNNGALGLCTCFWRRDIDYQPPSGGLDVGVCASAPPNPDGSVDLRETGDDASYAEGWHRLPKSETGPSFALKLLTENGVQRVGFWVRTGNFFAYAIGRPKDSDVASRLVCHGKCSTVEKSVGKSLDEVAKSLGDDLASQMEIVGSYLGLYGEVSNDGGAWTVLHSTDPCLIGCSLVGSKSTENALCCSTLSIVGKTKVNVGDTLSQSVAGSTAVVRKWEVVEIDCCDRLNNCF